MIAVNTSWRLVPWADVLHAGDFNWWRKYEGCPEFRGLRTTIERRAAETFEGVRLVKCRKPDDRLFLEPAGTIGWGGGNSGFQSLNIAVQAGCSKIILVGVDMRTDRGSHWHGPHPKGMKNPNEMAVGRWRRAMDAAARSVPGDVQVINCSPVSTLRNYPKMSLSAALAA